MNSLYHVRRAACVAWPKAAKAILSMTPVARPGLGTMAVDKHWRIYFDEEWMATQQPSHLTAIVLRQVSHMMLRHFRRGEELPPEHWGAWNTATDAAINGNLRAEGHLVPPDSVFAEKLGLPDLQAAEMYFRELLKQAAINEASQDEPDAGDKESDSSEQGESNETSDSGGTAEASGDPDCESGGSDGAEGSPGDATDGSDQRSAGVEQPTPAPGQSGSCSDGQQRPWELGEPTADAPAMDEYDQEQVIKQFAEAVQNGKGSESSGQWREWSKQVLKPKRDILAPLRRMIRQTCEMATGVGERSYRRPSRRSNADFVLPTNVCPIPRICVIVDTSGSMCERDIALSLGAVKSVLDGFRIRDGITFISADTRAHTVQAKLGNVNRCQLKGGGGTSMRMPIEHAASLKPKPQLLIVCTDGQLDSSDWPSDPKIPTLAVITQPKTSYYSVPQWLRTVYVND